RVRTCADPGQAACGLTFPDGGETTTKGARRRPSLHCSDWKDRGRPIQGRRDQFRQPSRGVPGWIPLGGPAFPTYRPVTSRVPQELSDDVRTTSFLWSGQSSERRRRGGRSRGGSRRGGRDSAWSAGGVPSPVSQWTMTPNSSAYVPPGLPSPSDGGTAGSMPMPVSV